MTQKQKQELTLLHIRIVINYVKQYFIHYSLYTNQHSFIFVDTGSHSCYEVQKCSFWHRSFLCTYILDSVSQCQLIDRGFSMINYFQLYFSFNRRLVIVNCLHKLSMETVAEHSKHSPQNWIIFKIIARNGSIV